jgi:hypothetical protein
LQTSGQLATTDSTTGSTTGSTLFHRFIGPSFLKNKACCSGRLVLVRVVNKMDVEDVKSTYY